MNIDPSYAILGVAMFGLFSWAIISSKSDHEDMLEAQVIELTEPKPEAVIGQPFLELVRLYNENHRRFSVDFKYDHKSCRDKYWLFDKLTKEKFHISRQRDDHGLSQEGAYSGIDWATTDELDYVVSKVLTAVTNRRVLLLQIRAHKAAAKLAVERDRLKKVYKV